MQQLEQLTQQALDAIEQATNVNELESIRVNYFGKKGHFTGLMQGLRDLTPEERPAAGQKINTAKQATQSALNSKKNTLELDALNKQLESEKIDVSLTGRREGTGGLHPVTITVNRIVKFFSELGFKVENGPEIENDYYNFDALNIPAHHPAERIMIPFGLMQTVY